MRLLREIQVGGVKVIVRELTVSEIRAWLEGVSDEALDLVDSSLFEEVSLGDLPLMTDLKKEVIDSLTPSEIDEVITVCREVNARFFAMRARLAEVGQRILNRQASEPVT